jgi:Trk K+ transport system NAD-binding subunit
VRAGGGLDGPTLRELSTGTRVLAVTTEQAGRRAANFRPTRHTRLSPGDDLLVVGPVTQIIETVRRNQQVDADRQAVR